MKVISRLFILLVSLNSSFFTYNSGWARLNPSVVMNLLSRQRECFICRENRPNNDFVRCTVCRQEACVDCLANIIEQRCPNCRTDFTIINGMKTTIRDKYLAKHNRNYRLQLARAAVVLMGVGGLFLTYKGAIKLRDYNPENYDTSTFMRKVLHTGLSRFKFVCSSLYFWFPEKVLRLLDDSDSQVRRIWNPAIQYPSKLERWVHYKNFTAAGGFMTLGGLALNACVEPVYKKIAGPMPAAGNNLPPIFLN